MQDSLSGTHFLKTSLVTRPHFGNLLCAYDGTGELKQLAPISPSPFLTAELTGWSQGATSWAFSQFAWHRLRMLLQL